jgi:hypothetical protein
MMLCIVKFDIIVLCSRFVSKNNGVLFENDLIQIGLKSEYRQNLGRFGMYYGNKTSFPLQDFSTDFTYPGDSNTDILFILTSYQVCKVVCEEFSRLIYMYLPWTLVHLLHVCSLYASLFEGWCWEGGQLGAKGI